MVRDLEWFFGGQGWIFLGGGQLFADVGFDEKYRAVDGWFSDVGVNSEWCWRLGEAVVGCLWE